MNSSNQLLTSALQLLRAAEIRVVSGGPADMLLILPDGRTQAVQVKVRLKPPPPSLLENLRLRYPDARFLFVTTHTTPYLRRLAERGGVDVIAVHESVAIFSGTTITIPTPSDGGPEAPVVRRGRKPWTRWAVERILLLTDQPMTQVDLAATLAVTQQSVSHVLRHHRYATRTENGWILEQRSDSLEMHLSEYPGPGGASTYWYGLDPAVRQGADAAKFTAEMGVDCLQTGDIAADVYAPWRLPAIASLYTRELLDFTPAGFTPASDSEHTLEATVPEDPTVWRTAKAAAELPPVRVGPIVVLQGVAPVRVDPIIALHDVLRSPGADAVEAAEHLRSAIEEGTWRG